MCERSGSTGKLVRGIENQLTRTRLDYHKMQISDILYLEEVFKNVRQNLNRPEDDHMLDQNVSVLISGSFMSTTMKAPVHLGLHYNQTLAAYRNTTCEELKSLFDIPQRFIKACHKEEGTEKHRLYHCPEWNEVRREIPEAVRKWEQKARTSKEEWKWQRGIVTRPLSESQWNRGHFSMKKWESEKHRSWRMPAERFKGHVATGGSLLGTAGKWRACGWSMVQLDFDEELGPLYGEGGADGLPLSSQESDWLHQSACRQQRS